ncbi:NAD(P)-dependent oxidoreductase, partial [Intrasporangium sp.]|uniref:NAD(P)-dependent oxidoreductase n=1 Tax=Intrasporangium sp. TaxID=1925024 RepID=UPI00293A2364
MDRDVTQVAVLGLGRMGTAMAERLSQGGHAVRAWSRTAKQVAGVDVRPTSAEAVAGARVVVLALFDAQACQEVLAACLEASAEDAIVVNTSTTGPGEAAELSDIVRERSRAYLHAPVMGSVPAVRSGSLTVLAGSDTVPAEVSRVLEALGTVVRCGDAQTAAAVKLVANQVLGESLAALGRTLASADALGVDRELVTDILERTALGRVVTAKRPWLEGHRGSAAFA